MKKIKNKKEVIREFDKENYFQALKKFKKKNPSLHDIDKFFYKTDKDFLYLKKEKKIMLNTIKKFYKNSSGVTELGCGYGSKSLELHKIKSFRKKKFYLIDISKNAINLIKLLLFDYKKYKKNIFVNTCDFYNQKIDKLKIPKKTLVFTSYSLIYRKKLTSKFLKSILKLYPNYVIHFEPTYEHFLSNTKRNKKIRNYFKKNDYSINLLSVLKKFEKMKKIKIIFEKKDVYGANKLLPFSIIIWKKTI